MAKYDELPVFKATYDLLLRIYMVSQHWSRDIRYTLGEELKKEVIEISFSLSIKPMPRRRK